MRNQFHSEYYQAIIQLRPGNEELIELVERLINEDKQVWISKKIKLKMGVDYYISSNRFARALGKKLKKKFKGVLKESKKLHGVDRSTSKERYRVTVCFRLDEEKFSSSEIPKVGNELSKL